MKFDHIGISSKDPKKTEAFYNEMLGLEKDPGNPGHPLTLISEEFKLVVSQRESGVFFKSYGDHLALKTNPANFDSARSALRDREEEFQLVERGGSKTLYFRDPDGNVLELICAS